MSADASTGRQVLLSELERDERRALLEESVLRGHDPEIREQLRVQLTPEITQLLAEPWLQELSLPELEHLDALPLWDWLDALDGYSEAAVTGEAGLKGAVEWHLLWHLDVLFDDPSDLLITAVFHDETYLVTTIRALRETAAAHGLDLFEVAKQAGWRSEGPNERPGSAPEEWWSVIEVDDRRAYFRSTLLGDRNEEDLPAGLKDYLARTVEHLLASPWVEPLSLDLLRELGDLPFWSWDRMACNLEDEFEEVPVAYLVKHHLYDEMASLLDEPGDYISQALFSGPAALSDHVNALRETANRYGIDLETLWNEESRT